MPYFGLSFSAREMHESANSYWPSAIALRAWCNISSACWTSVGPSSPAAALASQAWPSPMGGMAQTAAGEQLARKIEIPTMRFVLVFNPILLNRDVSAHPPWGTTCNPERAVGQPVRPQAAPPRPTRPSPSLVLFSEPESADRALGFTSSRASLARRLFLAGPAESLVTADARFFAPRRKSRSNFACADALGTS